MPHNKIPYILGLGLGQSKNKKNVLNGEELNYRLIDTSHTDSALEVLVGRSLTRLSSSVTSGAAGSGAGSNNKPSAAASSSKTEDYDDETNNVYHVMIKIWHTHLGYERTMLSVQDSLSDILPEKNKKSEAGGTSSSPPGKGNVMKNRKKKKGDANGSSNNSEGLDVRIHAILQYPRCYNELFTSESYLASPNFPIKYNNCSEEEDALDESTKKVGGLSPLLDKENAWKRSYRALEELYHHGTIESIGISNFGPSDLSQLFDLATVGPHVYQGSLRTLLSQQEMVETLVKHGVHYQCYDVASTVMNGKQKASGAYSKLERIGARHNGSSSNNNDGGEHNKDDMSSIGYSPVQVVLGWLIHHRGVGVIPGTTDARHLVENSPSTLVNMPRFTPREVLEIEMAVLSLVKDVEMSALSAVDDDENGSDGFGDNVDVMYTNPDGTSSRRSSSSGVNSEDEEGIVATFFNSLASRSVRIFQIHPTTGEQLQISHSIPSGRSGRMIVNVDDVLVAYDGHGVAVKKFLVAGDALVDGNGSVEFTVLS